MEIVRYLYTGNQSMQFRYNKDKIVYLNDLRYAFEYRSDAIISNMTPSAINYYRNSRDLGTEILISGQYMDSITLPYISLEGDGSKLTSPCSVKNSENWQCHLPDDLTDGDYTVHFNDQDRTSSQSRNMTLNICPPPLVEPFLHKPIKITESDPKFEVIGLHFCHDAKKLLVTKDNMTLCQTAHIISPEKFVCHLNLTNIGWLTPNETVSHQMIVYVEGKYPIKIINYTNGDIEFTICHTHFQIYSEAFAQ